MHFTEFYSFIYIGINHEETDFMDLLYGTDEWAKVLAISATFNSKEVGDICKAFRIDKLNIVTQNIMMRSEIHYQDTPG